MKLVQYKICMENMECDLSLVPRPLPDFILQLWRKIGRRPGIKTTSRIGNGGLGFVMMATCPHKLYAASW